eukprot:g14922.t1
MRDAILVRGDKELAKKCTLELNDLKPMHEYYFQVRAVASTGTSEWSQVAGPFKTRMAAPESCKDRSTQHEAFCIKLFFQCLGRSVQPLCEDLVITKNDIRKVGLRFSSPDCHGFTLSTRDMPTRHDYLIREEKGRMEVPVEEDLPIGSEVTCVVPNLTPGWKLYFDAAAVTQAGIGQFSAPTGEVICHCDKPGEPKPPVCKEKTKSTFVLEVQEMPFCFDVGQPKREDLAETNGSDVFRYELRYDLAPMMLKAVMVKGPMKCVQEVGAGPQADSKESLIVKYIQAGDLGAKYGGNITEYELRYARKEQYLDDPDAGQIVTDEGCSPDQVGLLNWPAPPHGESPPVRVGGLITGRTYLFQAPSNRPRPRHSALGTRRARQVRAVSPHGTGPWSFVSEPFKTLPSRPETPEPIEVVKGVLNPYSAKLKMVLPEGNGSPVTGCRLHFLGPNWKTQRWTVRQDEDTATLPVQYNWDFTVLHLEPGASYRRRHPDQFKFSCLNEVGESDTSEPSNLATTLERTRPQTTRDAPTHDAHGARATRGAAEVTTMPTIPDKCTAPFLASEEDAKPYSITFHWHVPHDGGSDIQFYTLIWATNMRFQGFKVIENITETSYTLDNVEPNLKFYLRVAATNDVGQGKFSDCIPHLGQGVVATIPRAPSAPRELKGEPHPKAVGAVLLKWLKPTEDGGCMIGRYRICYSLHEDFKEAKEVGHKAGREAKTEYYFKVAGVNLVGQGPYGESVMVKTEPMPPEKFIAPRQPEPPIVQLLSENGVDRLKVKWVCPENWDNRDKQTHMITHYSLYMQGGYPSPDVNEHEELRENIPQVRDYKTRPKNVQNVTTLEGLVPGRFYHCILKAFSLAGESPWSMPSEVIRAPPGLPNNIAEVHVTGKTTTSISFDWPSPSGNGESVKHFYVRCREVRVLRGWLGGSPASPEVSEASAGKYEEVDQWWPAVARPFQNPEGESESGWARRASVMGGITQTYVLEGLQPASCYELEVVAENAVGLSAATLSGRVKTLSTEPGPPSQCRGCPGDATINSVKFSWTAPTYHGGEDILGYEVRWIPNEVYQPAPTDIEVLLKDSQRFILGPDCFEFVAEGLHPGDAAVPIVRAWTDAGHGVQKPSESGDGKGGDTTGGDRNACEVEMEIAPILERTEAEDHRLYSLKATWICPDMMGRPILYFKLKLIRVDTEEDREAILASGRVPPPPASEEEPQEFTIECPPDRCWVMGETIEVGHLHKALTPGTPYVAYVRATSVVGDAKGWGVASAPEIAPPDYPSQPEKPTSPWQWPTALEERSGEGRLYGGRRGNLTQVHWTAPWLRGSDLESCEFVYSLDPDCRELTKVPHEVAHKSFEERQIHVEDLEYATTYYFKVRIKNGVGWSFWSEVSEGFMTGACRPAPPKRPILEHIDMERWGRGGGP